MKILKNRTIFSIALILTLTLAMLNFLPTEKSSLANAQTGTSDGSNLLQYDWPQMGQNSAFTHFSKGPAPASPDLLWQRNVNGAPIAFNGKVFSIDRNFIIAMDPFTGNIIYNASVPKIANTTTSVTKVFKIDENRMGVVVTSTTLPLSPPVWALRLLSIADGSLLWTDANPKISGARDSEFNYVSEEKMAYVDVGNKTGTGTAAARGFGAIEAWDLSDPMSPVLRWTYEADGTVSGPVYGEGKLFPNGGTPRQVCLDAKTGKVLWETELTGCPWYQGTYYEGKVLRGLLDNTFVAINATTGKVLWSVRPSAYGFWSSGTAAGYGMAYMANVDGYFYAFNATTGRIVWKYEGPGLMYPGFVQVADGKVYATTGQSSLSPLTPETSKSEYTCFDALTGKILWQLPEEFGSGPGDFACIAYGNFYACNSKRTGAPSQLTLTCFGSAKDWPMFLGNSAHTAIGYGGPTETSLRWKFGTNGIVMSSPAIAKGKVYVGSFDKNLYCLDANDGNKIWNYTTGNYIRSSPAVVNNKVYVGPDDGFVYCLDANTGSQLWKTAAPGSILHIITGTTVEYRSSPTVVNDKVYVGSLDGKVYCLNAVSGSIQWTIQTTGAIISTPTYISGDGLYFASVDGFVYKVNPDNGNVLWNQSTPIGNNIQMMGTPIFAEGKVFIPSGAATLAPAGVGQFYCLNATTGQFIWKTNELPGSGSMEPIWTMLYLNGKVYAGDFFSFSCINATSGAKLWSSFLTREHYGSPIYSDGKFYVPSDSFGIYILNATSGNKSAYIGVGGQVWSSPALYQGKLYFGANDWNVYCFEQSSEATIYYGPEPVPSPSPTSIPTPIPTPIPTIEPTPTQSPIQTSAPIVSSTPEPIATSTPTQPPSGFVLDSTMYAAIGVVVVIVIVALAALILRKRK